MADKLGFIQEKDIADFARLMRDYRSGRLFADPNRPTPVNGPSQRWIRARNDYDEPVPAFGVVSIVGAERLGDTQVLLSVSAPGYTSGDDLNGSFAFNSNAPIQPGEIGLVTCDTPTWARLYDGTCERGCNLCDSVTFMLLQDIATGIDIDKTLDCQLLSSPVPISGGYIGLVALPSDRCHAYVEVYSPAFSSGASGQLTLVETGHARGVDVDLANDVLIAKKSGVFLCEYTATFHAAEDSTIEYTMQCLYPNDTVRAGSASGDYGCTFSASSLTGYQTGQIHFRWMRGFYAGEKLKLNYECSTDADFYLSTSNDILSMIRLG